MQQRTTRRSPALDQLLEVEAWLGKIGGTAPFTALLDLLDDLCVFVINEEGRIAYWTTGAGRLFDISSRQVIGLPAEAAAQVVGCAAAFGNLKNSRSLSWVTPTGQHREARFAVRAIDSPRGRQSSITVVTPITPTLAQSIPAQAGILADEAVNFYGLVSRDPSLLQAFQIIRNVAETDSTVLVRGESGTGKEIVAGALHTLSSRKSAPFLAVNCAALTPSLLETELFGHVRGAFTGAVKDHAGLFKRADQGTVFLDEVAEIPLDIQAKLLRVLQERTFLPVGADKPVKVDVRIVSATHRSLREEVKAGRFREDLMYRLRVVPIFLPPLRERRGDVSLLLRHFIEKHNTMGPRKVTAIDPEAMRRLLDHDWPGNVRELQNVIEYAFAVGRGPELLLEELPPEFREARGSAIRPRNPGPAPQDEAAKIQQVLQECQGRIEDAAMRLGMNRSTLWRKRKRYGI